jgi:hypothetical protein
MNNSKSAIIVLAFATIPYLLVAWGYTALVGGGTIVFWIGLGLLLGARLFFALIEMVGSILAWRLHGRRIMVENFLRFLRTKNFPRRYYDHDGFTNYLDRVENDDALSPSLRRDAKEWYKLLGIFEDLGIFVGARMHSATEIALETYSPRANAPRFVLNPPSGRD